MYPTAPGGLPFQAGEGRGPIGWLSLDSCLLTGRDYRVSIPADVAIES